MDEAANKLWEALCDGCGKCCAISGNRQAGEGVACPSLDTDTNRCKNYENRLELELCLKVTPSNVLYLHRTGVLPDSCAYVRFVQRKPPLPRPVARARLIPFNVASVDLTQRYILKREEWLG